MSSHIVYGCHCLNIKAHVSSKYKDSQGKTEKTFVKEPLPGWELDLGMGGIIVEYSALIKTSKEKGFLTVSCLNCEMSPVYSAKEHDNTTRVIIHEKALSGKELDNIKNAEEYSKTFKIKITPTSTTEIPQLIPEELDSTQQQLKAVLDQSVEKLSLESKVRIENYKKEEERKLQDFASQAKLENTYLLHRLIRIRDEEKGQEKEKKEKKEAKEGPRVRFNEKIDDDDNVKKTRNTGFALDENQMKGLDNKISVQPTLRDGDDTDEEDQDEDMFNLDEEFSEQEEEHEEQEEQEEEKKKAPSPESSHDVFGTSWIRKKRNTGKYMTEDFDIARFKNTASRKDEDDDDYVSKYATSVPISIHYPQFNEEQEDEDQVEEGSKKKDKKDLLTSSFAHYDFSYPDRMLSEQFPQRRRKSLLSNSMIKPQLDTLVGKSLDTRGIMQKKQNIREKDEESFGPMQPPHLWTKQQEDDEDNTDDA